MHGALFKSKTLFADAQAVAWAAQAVSTLAARATVEEEHGVVHVAVPAILISLVGALVAVEQFQSLVRAASMVDCTRNAAARKHREAAAKALFGHVDVASKHAKRIDQDFALCGHALEIHDSLVRAT